MYNQDKTVLQSIKVCSVQERKKCSHQLKKHPHQKYNEIIFEMNYFQYLTRQIKRISSMIICLLSVLKLVFNQLTASTQGSQKATQ